MQSQLEHTIFRLSVQGSPCTCGHSGGFIVASVLFYGGCGYDLQFEKEASLLAHIHHRATMLFRNIQHMAAIGGHATISP